MQNRVRMTGTSGSTFWPPACDWSSATRDWVLGPGEVAEVDTQVPHWFGSTGEEPVEILSVFARQGESMRARTLPQRS
jgi:quercetin dioxygenase-like cupin family protein